MKAASSAAPAFTARSPPPPPPRRRACGVGAETAEQHVDDAAVHALAHDVGQDRARRADQRPGDDQGKVLDGEADAAGSPAGIAVEHRHHDRHVGAADRNDEQEAEADRQQRHQPEQCLRAGHHEQDDQQHQQRAQAGIEQVLALEGDRIALHQRLQLGEGDQRAREGDAADRQAERHFHQALGVDRAGHTDRERLRRVQGGGRHEHRGQAHQRVKRGDQLRQRRHLDPPREDRADAAADGNRHQDQRPAAWRHSLPQQRRQDGDGHAGHAHAVAGAGGLGVGQATQRQDKEDRGNEIGKRGQAGRHRATYPCGGTCRAFAASPGTRRRCSRWQASRR